MKITHISIATSICALATLCESATSTTPVSLEPLTPQTWTVSHSLDGEKDVPIAIALRAAGKQLGMDYADVDVDKAAVYGDPLSVCSAIIHAAFSLDEAWWGGLSAPAEMRGEDGVPTSSYKPDSQANWYSAFTAHTKIPTFPIPTAAEIVTYMRVGGLHGFIVQWTQTDPDSTIRKANDLIPVQEFSPGKFRFAPEWLGLTDAVAISLKDCQPELPELKSYRERDPAYIREVEVKGLYGDTVGENPLTILFRAMLLSDYPRASEIQALQQKIAILAGQIPQEESEYEGSKAQQELAGLLTQSSIEMLEKQSIDKRRDISFFSDGALLIDADAFTFLFRRDKRTGEVDTSMAEIYNDSGKLKLANFRVQGGFTELFYEPSIWEALSAQLNAVLASATE